MRTSRQRFFARQGRVEPDLARWPDLARALLFGPLTSISFRLEGRDYLADAAEQVMADARAFGAVPSPELTPEQSAQLRALSTARRDPEFAAFVERVTPVASR